MTLTKAKAKAKAGVKAQTKAETKARAGAKAETKARAGVKAQTKARAGKKSGAKAKAKASGTLRIVGGQLRGRKFLAPPGELVRPTSDRVRECLFNMLEHLTAPTGGEGSPLVGARVLDRFAGSGALGLEALSRGAAQVWFIEQATSVQKILKQNVALMSDHGELPPGIRIGNEQLLGVSQASLDQATLPCPLNSHNSLDPFDIIFCDPPYGMNPWRALVDGFAVAGLLRPGSLLVCETDSRDPFPDLADGWAQLKDRTLGRVRLQIFAKRAIVSQV